MPTKIKDQPVNDSPTLDNRPTLGVDENQTWTEKKVGKKAEPNPYAGYVTEHKDDKNENGEPKVHRAKGFANKESTEKAVRFIRKAAKEQDRSVLVEPLPAADGFGFRFVFVPKIVRVRKAKENSSDGSGKDQPASGDNPSA